MSAEPMPSTIAHLDALTATGGEGYIIVSTIDPAGGGGWRSASFGTDQVDAAAAFCRAADDRGLNVYVRTNLLKRRIPSYERGKHGDTGAAVAFALDLDIAGPSHKQGESRLPLPPTLEAAMTIVADLPTPSLTIRTGGGDHLWWLLDEPEHDRPVELLEEFADRIVEAGRVLGYGVDRPDASRVLRVAGTHRRKAGIETNRVQLVDVAGWPLHGLSQRPWCPAGRYGARDLLDALPTPAVAAAPSAPLRPRRPGEVGPADAVSALSWADILEPANWTFVNMGTVEGSAVEFWLRPGGTSDYSAKCFVDGPAVVWSDACGLPAGRGQRLNKWRIFCHLYFNGNEADAARTIRLASRGVAA